MMVLLRADVLDVVVGRRVHEAAEAYRRGHHFGKVMLTGFVSYLFRNRFTDISPDTACPRDNRSMRSLRRPSSSAIIARRGKLTPRQMGAKSRNHFMSRWVTGSQPSGAGRRRARGSGRRASGSGRRRRGFGEQGGGLGEAAGAVEGEGLGVAGVVGGGVRRRGRVSSNRSHPLAAAVDGDGVDLARGDAGAGGRPGGPGDEDGGAVDLVHPLQARGEVHGVAQRGVVEAARRADVADDGGAGVRGRCARAVRPGARRGRVAAAMPASIAQSGAAGVEGLVRVGGRGTPEGHDRVADELVDRAALGLDRLAGELQELADDRGPRASPRRSLRPVKPARSANRTVSSRRSPPGSARTPLARGGGPARSG